MGSPSKLSKVERADPGLTNGACNTPLLDRLIATVSEMAFVMQISLTISKYGGAHVSVILLKGCLTRPVRGSSRDMRRDIPE